MDSLTGKHLAHAAHVAPNSGFVGFWGKKLRGGMGDMGGMFFAFTILRAHAKILDMSTRGHEDKRTRGQEDRTV